MTASEVMVSLTGTPTGTCISLISRTPSGCWMCHIHCLPTTNISTEDSGGREFRTYSTEAHTKITNVISVGTIVQVSSSDRCVLVSAGISSGDRRRNFTMKKKIIPKIRAVKNNVSAVRK